MSSAKAYFPNVYFLFRKRTSELSRGWKNLLKLGAGGKPSTWLPPGMTRRALVASEHREATECFECRSQSLKTQDGSL